MYTFSKKKFRIGLMLQDFLIEKGALFPELHLYHLYKALAQKSSLYDLWFVLDDGSVLSKDLSQIVGYYKEFNFNFVLSYGHIPTLEVFKVGLDWVSKFFTTKNDAKLFSLAPYAVSASASMYGINALDSIHCLPPRMVDLLTPTLAFNNHGALVYRSPQEDFSSARVFYAAASQPLFRHGGLLRCLDELGCCDFYGPQNQWKNIKSYRGALPYDDGTTLLNTVNMAGIYLAIHSPIHVHTQIYTTRVVEAISAGALVITDKMDSLEELCGANAFYIDSSRPDDEVCHTIQQIVDWVHLHPTEARDKVLKLQDFFRDRFGEGDWIPAFCEAVEVQKLSYYKRLEDAADQDGVDVLYFCQRANREGLANVCKQVQVQKLKKLHLILVTVPELVEQVSLQVHGALRDAPHITWDVLVMETNGRRADLNNSGKMFLKACQGLKYSFFTFINEHISWTDDHLLRLIWEMKSGSDTTSIVYSHVHYVRGVQHVKTPTVKADCETYLEDIHNGNNYSKRNFDKANFLASFRPITVQNFLDLAQENNFIDTPYQRDLSKFEANVEMRLPKGGQLFKRTIVEALTPLEKISFARLDGAEHLLPFYLLLIKKRFAEVCFSRYSSCGLHCACIPDGTDGEKNPWRYALYPQSPLNHSVYRRTVGNISFQLYDALMPYRTFWSCWSESYLQEVKDFIPQFPIMGFRQRSFFIELLWRIGVKIVPSRFKPIVKKILRLC